MKNFKPQSIIIYTVIIFLAIAFVVSFQLDKEDAADAPAAKPTPAPVVLKTYVDPQNNFRMNVPTTWATTVRSGTEKSGLKTAHPTTSTREVTTFMKNSVGINIAVDDGPAPCNVVKKTNAILGGVPAVYDAKRHYWVIYTTAATYTVGYFYPGLPVFHTAMGTAPVSQAEMNANQTVVIELIKSFLPKNLTPLKC